jgi:hypothetical protein
MKAAVAEPADLLKLSRLSIQGLFTQFKSAPVEEAP